MPWAPNHPCAYPQCATLVKHGRYCAVHRRQENKQLESVRPRKGSSTQRGYDSRWRIARRTFLRDYPWCIECRRAGACVPATIVDHIVPHKGDGALFWDRSDWQPLCKACHDRKTAVHDGRWKRRS